MQIRFKKIVCNLILLIVSSQANIFARDSVLGMSEYELIPAALNPITRAAQTTSTQQTKIAKPWTVMVYMAADNDLRGFAARNIKQMAAIGSNENINIIVQLDIRISGDKKITRRYYIDKGHITHMNADDPTSQSMDSGDANTLISFCTWTIKNYPAQDYALVLWNHGTGIIDPVKGRIINASELFNFNPTTNRLELDRSVGFLDLMDAVNSLHLRINHAEDPERGIAWDDSTGNYLTNQKLDFALNEIKTKVLNGKKFSIIGFDACLMSMIEVGNLIKPYTQVMVGSQEVELGTGWDYSQALAQFSSTKSPTVKSFAKQIVKAYENTYMQLTNDYTQSAVDLEVIDIIESDINAISTLLLDCFKKQRNNSVQTALKTSRNKLLLTHFDEPTYVDLYHWLSNLQTNIKFFEFTNEPEGKKLKDELSAILVAAKQHIETIVFANCCGKNLSGAHGLSIYFPERRIHASYRKTPFAQSNEWTALLTQYLLL